MFIKNYLCLILISTLTAGQSLADSFNFNAYLGYAELNPDTRIIYNFNGAPRYVKSNDREVKLFMSVTAVRDDNPTDGFMNRNHYKDSCGPTAAMNVFTWYGIDVLEGQRCFWLYESEQVDVPPTWVCQDRLNSAWLGYQMETNRWRLLGSTMPGTNTGNFLDVYRDYMERYLPSDLDLQYAYEDGNGQLQYQILWATLEQGNPIVVNYKTGSTKGHFATIVGIEKVGNDDIIGNDKIFLANPRKEDYTDSISYAKFRRLWRRDYHDFGFLAHFGERRYTRINLWDSTQLMPFASGGGGLDREGDTFHRK